MARRSSRGTGISRRSILKMSGAGLAGVGLAGCVQSQNGDGGDGGDGGNGGDGGDGGDGTDGGDGGDGGDGTTTTREPLETVKFGFLIPQTGPISSLGQEMQASISLAIDHLNSDTGFDLGFQVESAIRDTETDVSTAVQAANRLVSEDEVDLIVGPISSATSLAVSDFASEEEIVVAPTSSSLSLTGSDCNQFTFRAETHSGQAAEAGYQWIVDNLGTDVWFHIADYAYGQSVREEWGTRLEDAGASIVGDTAASPGTTNFEPFISQISDEGPDVVLVGSAGGDLFNFIGQAAAQGLTQETNIFGDSSIVQLTRRAIGNAAVGTYGMARFNPTFDNERMRRFVEAWRNEHDRTPGNFSRTGYQTVTMLAQGIEEAGTTEGNELSNVIAGLTVDSFFGENQFRACDHQAVNPLWVGEFVSAEGSELPDIEYHQYTAGQDAIPSCESVGCDLA